MRAEHPPGARRRLWAWILLAAIEAVYVLTIVRMGPAANFGEIQDDALYFSAAKALAAGQGYIAPSFPGGLAHLKYPELYPWALAWIWRWDPHFPGNVNAAIGLTLAFACWFLTMCFLTAKKTMGLGDGGSLLVAALCAFNFFALFVGGSVLSDVPFAALLLTAALAADRALEPGAHWGWAAAAGALGGISMGLRALGAAIVAGMTAVALVRRAYGRAGVMMAAGGALALPWLLPAVLRAAASTAATAAAVPQGWAQTLAFYSSYVGQWRQFVPDWLTQRAVLVRNSLNVLADPGIFLLSPIGNRSALVSAGAGSLAALGAWAGALAGWRRGGLRAIHAIFLFYIAAIVPWPFPPHRFFLPFLPLVFGGMAVIARDIARAALPHRAEGVQGGNRAAAIALSAALAALGVVAAANYGYAAPRQLAGVMAAQRSLLAEKRQAYDWIRNHAPAEARFIAYDDALLYLYTGRQAVRAIACSSASFYTDSEAPALRDAEHLGDVARQVDAGYWMTTSGDFGVELGPDQDILTRRQAELAAGMKEVFRSDGGRVRIYEIK